MDINNLKLKEDIKVEIKALNIIVQNQFELNEYENIVILTRIRERLESYLELI